VRQAMYAFTHIADYMKMSDTYIETLQKSEFWSWVLSKYSELPEIPKGETILLEWPNLFNGRANNLQIDLSKQTCTDGSTTWNLASYIAELEELDIDQATNHLLLQVGKYQKEREDAEATAWFSFDKDSLIWLMRERNSQSETKMVTNFNIVFISIIKEFNPDANRWERIYECYLEYYRDDRRRKSEVFRLTPDDCLTDKNFQKAIWQIDFLQSFFSNSFQTQFFISFLADYYKPKEITQYDHYGFIQHNGHNYYLTANCLVRIPRTLNQQLQLIAPNEQGAFRIDAGQYIMLDPYITNAPRMDLGMPDEDTYLYSEDIKVIENYADDRTFSYELRKIEDKLCEMIGGGGNRDHYSEGRFILAYIFSFHYFDQMMTAFGHIIYMYLYGVPNTGKDKMCEVILSAFGLSGVSSMSEPTARALENALSYNSKVPTWLNEFKPEMDSGKKPKISDQTFNTWFQLVERPTSSGMNRRKNEYKVVRSMILFASNYIPLEEHIKSRAIKLEYAYHKRGGEENYYWLAENRRFIQHLYIAWMMRWPQISSRFIVSEMLRYKAVIKKEVEKQTGLRTKRNGIKYTVYDRQIEQMAVLVVTYNEIMGISKEIRQYIALNDNASLDHDLRKVYENIIFDLSIGSSCFKAAVKFLVETATEDTENNILTVWLATVGYLTSDLKVYGKHYYWTQEGHLKMYFNGIWEIYEYFKGKNSLRRIDVEATLQKLASKPEQSTFRWTPDGLNKQAHKGYMILNARDDDRFAYAFNAPHLTYTDTKGE
jgi:hypothetical protein